MFQRSRCFGLVLGKMKFGVSAKNSENDARKEGEANGIFFVYPDYFDFAWNAGTELRKCLI